MQGLRARGRVFLSARVWSQCMTLDMLFLRVQLGPLGGIPTDMLASLGTVILQLACAGQAFCTPNAATEGQCGRHAGILGFAPGEALVFHGNGCVGWSSCAVDVRISAWCGGFHV